MINVPLVNEVGDRYEKSKCKDYRHYSETEQKS